jgi:secreted PhoX family phosphatase
VGLHRLEQQQVTAAYKAAHGAALRFSLGHPAFAAEHAAHGAPVGLSGAIPVFKFVGSNTAAEQEAQLGIHHSGIHLFKHPITPESSATGLLVIGHEFANHGLLDPDGMATWKAAKVRKAPTAHGCIGDRD